MMRSRTHACRVTRSAALCAVSVALCAGCASHGPAYAEGATHGATTVVDSTPGILVPAGYGTLRQDDISMQIRLPSVLVRATPLDESVIRLLSPDSYRAMRALRDGQQGAVDRAAAQLGVNRPSLWYLSFFGLQPDSRYTARDVDIMSGARDFRPLDVLPLTAGFGSERVDQRQVQSAVYVFDNGIDLSQPLTITVDGVGGTSWTTVMRTIEQERALVRGRVGSR